MKLHRKLSSKSTIDYAITFVAGIIMGWLIKPKQQLPEEWDWEEWSENHPPDYNSSGKSVYTSSIKPVDEANIPMNIETVEAWNIIKKKLKKPKWKSNNGWIFGNNGFGIKIIGSWDRELTPDEIKRIYSVGENGIRASFEDTQEIKIDKSFK